jgi:hypothetical protein
LAKSLLGGDIFSCGLLIYFRVLQAMRWSMLKKVPRVTTSWGQPSLEAKLSGVESCYGQGVPLSTLPAIDKFRSGT